MEVAGANWALVGPGKTWISVDICAKALPHPCLQPQQPRLRLRFCAPCRRHKLSPSLHRSGTLAVRCLQNWPIARVAS